MTDQQHFDALCERFTSACARAKDWRHQYFGAAYSSRIKEAIRDLETTIAELRKHHEFQE